jgi:hypothetical protein
MRKLRTIVEWVSVWDVVDWVAAAMCVVPFAIMMFGTPAVSGPIPDPLPVAPWETALSLILVPIAAALLMPFLSAPQFVNFWLVRHTRGALIRGLLLLISAVMLVPFYKFTSTADLTSTSTAPLEAIFYPIYLAAYSVPVSLVLFGIDKLIERSNRSTP